MVSNATMAFCTAYPSSLYPCKLKRHVIISFTALRSLPDSNRAEISLPTNLKNSRNLLNLLQKQNDPKSALEIFNSALNSKDFAPSYSVYEEILKQFAKSGSFEEMNLFLRQMNLNGFKINTGIFLFIIESYVKFQLFDEAVDLVLNQMEQEFDLKPDITIYNNLLNLLVEEGNKLKLIETIFTEMEKRGIELDTLNFNILIKSLCKNYQTKAATQMLDEMSERNLPPNEATFTTIMQGFIEEENLNLALEIKDKMVKDGIIKPTNTTINLLINGFCKAGRVEESFSFIQEEKLNGFKPDKLTFNALTNGLCQSKLTNQTGEILEFMLNEGYDPDLVTYNTLINNLCENNKIETAIEVLDRMVNRNCLPNLETYNTLINALCNANRVDEAIDLAHSLTVKGFSPNTNTFNHLINGLLKTNEFELAYRMFEEMRDNGCKPDKFTYNSLIIQLCTKKRLEEALTLFKEANLNGCEKSDKSYNVLINSLCKEKRLEEALDLFDEMEMNGVSRSLVCYNSLIDGLCKTNRIDDAKVLMDQMVLDGFKPDKVTYNSLLNHYCKEGNVTQTTEILESMIQNGFEPDRITYSTIINCLCKARRVEYACTLLRGMVIKGMKPGPRSYNPVISSLFRAKRNKEAMLVFREMEKNGEKPDRISYDIVMRGLSCGGGSIYQAVDFLVELVEKGFVPEFSSFSNLAKGLLNLRKDETVVKLVRLVMNRAEFREGEIKAVNGLFKIRKFDEAIGTFGRILREINPPKKEYFNRRR